MRKDLGYGVKVKPEQLFPILFSPKTVDKIKSQIYCRNAPKETTMQSQLVPFEVIANYEHPQLIARLERECSMSHEEAEQLFFDTKQFMYLCALMMVGTTSSCLLVTIRNFV
jgi:hypothetical protein